tara:strand:- start:136128 stop:136388 length:261 start_codon:yes stop_codon:yes gene_type:complete
LWHVYLLGGFAPLFKVFLREIAVLLKFLGSASTPLWTTIGIPFETLTGVNALLPTFTAWGLSPKPAPNKAVVVGMTFKATLSIFQF